MLNVFFFYLLLFSFILFKKAAISAAPFFYIVEGLGKVCNSFCFVFFARTISRITRSPSIISIPCRRGSPPLVRCSASHSVRMRTQRKPAASKADPISDRSLRLEAQYMRGIAASMRPMCSMQFFINFCNKKLRYELLGVYAGRRAFPLPNSTQLN